mgnify:CR=1 FL=1
MLNKEVQNIHNEKYVEWKCPKCGTINKKGTLACINCANLKEIYDENERNIENKIMIIKGKLDILYDLKITINKINNTNKEKIITRQDKIIEYLENYLIKYCSVLLKYKINKEIENRLYNNKEKLSEVYDELVKIIKDNYSNLLDKYISCHKDTLEHEKDEYIKIIDQIIQNEIIKKTNTILDDISPLEDNKDTIVKIKEVFINNNNDNNILDETYDRFIAEMELL